MIKKGKIIKLVLVRLLNYDYIDSIEKSYF